MHQGIQKYFLTESGDLQVAPSSINRHSPRDANYVTVVSGLDALGQEAAGNLMLSCLAGLTYLVSDLAWWTKDKLTNDILLLTCKRC